MSWQSSVTIYLTASLIIEINQKTIFQNGGNRDFAGVVFNESSFLYLIDAIDSELYGDPKCPTDLDKAVFYATKIIRNHIFYDGNKRTGIICAMVFLAMNGHTPKMVTSEDIIELGLGIASNKISDEEVRIWFMERYPTSYCCLETV